jgi:hypothetical protein
MRALAICLAGGLLLSGPAARSARADPVTPDLGALRDIEELSLEGLLGTVSAASGTEESVLMSPAPVTVLDPQDIRASGATSLPDLLRQVAGAQVVRTGPGDFIVSLRGAGGIAGNNLVVLLDGVPVANRVDGTVDWTAIPVDLYNIERIEVVRGPVSAIYGANAMTGVVALTSRRPGERRVEGGARLGVAVDHDGRPGSLMSGWIGGKWRPLRVSASVNGLYDSTFTTAGGDGGRANPLWGAGAHLRGELELGKRAGLTFTAGGAYRRRGEADELVLAPERSEGALSLASLRLAVRDLPSVLDTLDVWIGGKWQWSAPLEGPGVGSGPARSTINILDGDAGFDLRLDLPWGFSAALGASAGLDRVAAPRLLQPDADGQVRGRYGASFLFAADPLRHLRFSAVGRLDYSPRTAGLRVTGRASAIYHGPTHSIRLSLARGFREPTYLEFAGELRDRATGLLLAEGNPAIRPPWVDTLELGAIVAPGSYLTLAVSFFAQRVSHPIELGREHEAHIDFFNEEEELLNLGGEVEARWRVNEHLTLLCSLTGLWWLNADPESDELTYNPRQNSPVMAWVGARTSFLAGRIFASAGVGYAAARVYDTPAGIPMVKLDVRTPHQVRLEGAGDFQPFARLPLRAFLKLQAFLPHGMVESPFSGAGRLGSVVMLGAEYHAD